MSGFLSSMFNALLTPPPSLSRIFLNNSKQTWTMRKNIPGFQINLSVPSHFVFPHNCRMLSSPRDMLQIIHTDSIALGDLGGTGSSGAVKINTRSSSVDIFYIWGRPRILSFLYLLHTTIIVHTLSLSLPLPLSPILLSACILPSYERRPDGRPRCLRY